MQKNGISPDNFNITVSSVNKALAKEWKGRWPDAKKKKTNGPD